MISGADTIVPGKPVESEAYFILVDLHGWWPDLVIQNADADVALSFAQADELVSREFFVYCSREAFESWQKDGAIPDNDDAMMHFILGETSTTIVSAPKPSFTYDRATDLASILTALRGP